MISNKHTACSELDILERECRLSRRNLSITMSGRPCGSSSIDQEYGSSDSEDSIPGSPDLFPMGSEVSIVGLQ